MAEASTGDRRHSWAHARKRSSACLLPTLEGSVSLSTLADLTPSLGDDVSAALPTPTSVRKLVRRASTLPQFHLPPPKVQEEDEEPPVEQQPPYVLAGVLSLVFGVLSVVPYNAILRSDPGSPLFIGFATHIFFVAINAHELKVILFERKIPLVYHLGFVALGFAFTTLKSDAFVRLPASLCMLLMNLQMLVAMVMQRLVFGDRYSLSQISGCALVTMGVVVGGRAGRQRTAASAASADSEEFGLEAMLGVAEMFGALVSLTALSILVKVAFSRFGEAVEEQIVMQHLGALPLFLVGSQWQQSIRPRLLSWTTGGDWYLVLLLAVNMSVTFAGQATQVRFAGRAPNLLIVQLVDTLKKFASLLVTALLAAPPFPPLGFWAGSLALALGTLQFLSSSDAPQDEDEKGD